MGCVGGGAETPAPCAIRSQVWLRLSTRRAPFCPARPRGPDPRGCQRHAASAGPGHSEPERPAPVPTAGPRRSLRLQCAVRRAAGRECPHSANPAGLRAALRLSLLCPGLTELGTRRKPGTPRLLSRDTSHTLPALGLPKSSVPGLAWGGLCSGQRGGARATFRSGPPCSLGHKAGERSAEAGACPELWPCPRTLPSHAHSTLPGPGSAPFSEHHARTQVCPFPSCAGVNKANTEAS